MIRFEHVSKSYVKGRRVVEDLNFEVEEGELVCLIGPSGCGKTTTLKMINRLVDPSEGKIFVSGHDVTTMEPATLRRRIGYVIQQIGLFPHLTVEDNIALVPRLLGWSKDECSRRVNELLPLVGLDPQIYRKRYPRQLSGGQQQRVGVLRALAGNQNIILMDEPFSALDPIVRETMQMEVKQLQNALRKTIVFVTHDVDEALKIATRIIVMDKGKIVQSTTPIDLLKYPANQFVQDFLGKKRLIGVAYLHASDAIERRFVTIRDDSGPEEFKLQYKQAMRDSIPYVMVINEAQRVVGVLKEDSHTPGNLSIYPSVAISADTLLIQAMEQMIAENVQFLSVMNPDGRFLGVISWNSLRHIFQGVSPNDLRTMEDVAL